MKEKNIRVLKVEPGQTPEEVCLINTLEELQKAVSIGAAYTGLIEIVELDENTCVLCNEEGKLIGLAPNRRLGHDILCGVFYVTGQDKYGNLTSLHQKQLAFYSQVFAVPDVFEDGEVEKACYTAFHIL